MDIAANYFMQTKPYNSHMPADYGAYSQVLVKSHLNLTMQSVANAEMLTIPWCPKCKIVVKIKLHTVDTYSNILYTSGHRPGDMYISTLTQKGTWTTL